jgi:probable blue pigment (indigoidine) exporter
LASVEGPGVAFVLIGLLAFTYSTVLARETASGRQIDTVWLTGLPLIAGGGLLLCVALPIEGMPRLSLNILALIGLLALVNTVVAYALYNHALRQLTAFEMNSLYNLSPLGTAILAWFLLGESLRPVQILAMLVVIVGVAMVQFRKRPAGFSRRRADN